MKRIIPPLVFLLAGCAAPVIKQPTVPPSACRDHFRELDSAVEQAGVRDYGPTPVPGFPYLRVNRFLSSFSDELDNPTRFDAWVARLARLDRIARRYEVTALSTVGHQQVLTDTEHCREELVRTELSSEANRRLLRKQARVPDDYITAWRVLGIYPVSALFVKAGITRWHEQTRPFYDLPIERLPRRGQLRQWAAPSAPRFTTAEIAAVLSAAAQNPLAIPEPTPEQREQLFASFAPQWSIDTVDKNDLPGAPHLTPGGPTIDTTLPILYRRLSHTRFHGEVLLQLNYIIWFPSRPPRQEWDIYAGAFDGINFRITLGMDGRPLLYDTIHNCGCYHRLFPVSPLRFNAQAFGFWSESPLVLQHIKEPGTVPVLHVSSRTHFINRLSFTESPTGETYLWDDYTTLRSLSLPDGRRRSLFGKHGIIEDSKRPERFILWPMGIRSPGAMRQWGHHPTAFVGRRHFDDPTLLDSLLIKPEQ
jgi:hypothetical protein